MRAFVYLLIAWTVRAPVRLSTASARAASSSLQVEAGRSVAHVHLDDNVTASSRKPRPQYIKMLGAIDAREAAVLVAWHVDRLTRKLSDLEHLIEFAQNTGLRSPR